MSRARRVIAGAVLFGVALVVALVPRAQKRHATASLEGGDVPAEMPAGARVASPPVAKTVPAPAPPVAAPLAATDSAMTREQKQGLARAAEAGRIAAREQKLSALDWDAARPGAPPADRRVPVSKKEGELTVAEKLEKTERIASQLQERIRRTQQAADAAAKRGEESGAEVMLLARLQSRVSELERTAQALRGEHASPETVQ